MVETGLRLQKYLADCGVASRRASETLITAGKVKVNGQVVTKLGTKINPGSDRVEVQGKRVRYEGKKIYLKLNKPRGVVSACSDPKERTVIDLIKDVSERLYPIGRLDKDSEGLILLTNDGELANRLMHPRYEHEKEYVVTVQFPIFYRQLERLEAGVIIDEKQTLPAKVNQVGSRRFHLILKEGRNRQVRKMVEAVGNKVVRLKRIRIGSIGLGDLRPGEYDCLTRSEIERNSR
ncbi:rRNA pseudouridine synthase [Candidatus Saganbacteria bacterium CG08_land_8_20_14_0_20_45_16]|uniref:Pseudouridine synthase n=1 Tax=Candidatus Saganbacteria bacterium CG08_land_8_20_14_0_20_45_16 TaxID=2014293 RepID=A0A2H0XTR2_UNCSA|nr:MAG: rRNA pseudouridine synthase [Candidatus Saganbacteria bacterium CG08_land_8_20_14_0_20_45_16]